MLLAKRHDEESPICSDHLISGFTQLGWKMDPVCSERDRLGYPEATKPSRFPPPPGGAPQPEDAHSIEESGAFCSAKALKEEPKSYSKLGMRNTPRRAIVAPESTTTVGSPPSETVVSGIIASITKASVMLAGTS